MTVDADAIRSALSSRYAVGEEIGQGGMAVVFRGHDPQHDRAIAIKVMRPELAVAVGADRFLREIRIESQLQHPNILPLFDSGQAGQFLYYVMPYAEGGSLADRLAQERHLSLDEAVRITREVGEALSYAHAHGVVHRDVKPANIMLRAGHAVIADFGVAKALADVDMKTLTDSGVAIGTPSYMSPEQASAEDRIEPRSDQYSLACVLFEMLAGEPPFTGRTIQAVVARHMSERPPSLAAVRPDLPPPMSEVIAKALSKVPAERFSSVEQFLHAMEAATQGVPMPAARTRRRATLIAAAGAALMLVALWLWLRPLPLELSRSRVAVFPLAARGPGVASTGAGTDATYLIEAALEQAGPLRFIDVTSRLDERQLANPEAVTSATARKIARAQRAAFYVQGVVQGHGDSLTVILRLYDVSGDSLVVQHSATGAVTEVPIHHLGIDAVKGLLPALIDPTHTVDLTPLRDRRANAVALWMQGEREYRHAKFSLARQFYERAFGEDSSLALAAIKGAQSANWLHDRERGLALVNLALERDSLLPPRYVLLARGLGKYWAGESDSAVHWLSAAAAQNRGWSEALTALGEVYYHQLPMAAPLDSLAYAAFRDAIEADSGFAPPLFHAIAAQLRHGSRTQSERLFRQFLAMGPDPLLRTQLEFMRVCVASPAKMKWPVQVATNAVAVLQAAKELSVAGYQYPCAEGAFRALLASSTVGRSERWGALLGLFSVLVATGRDQEARVLIDSAAVRTGAVRSLYVIGAAAGARMDAQSAALEAFARTTYGAHYERIPTAENVWIIALWLHRQGNATGLHAADSMLTARASRTADPRDAFFASAIHARNASTTDTTRAIALLRASAGSIRGHLGWGIGSALPADHLLLARLLLARGAYREALDAASVYDHAEPIMFLPFVPASVALRYQAAMAMGDASAARKYRVRLQDLNRSELLPR